MSRSYKIFFIAALIPFLFTACKKAEETQQPFPIKKAPAQQPAEVKAPETTDLSAQADSTVDVKLRNPFQSHIVVMKGVEGAKKIRGPLECCELSLFRLIAVVVGEQDGYALLQAPDGKRYVIRRGDVLGTREGKVVKIFSNGITVRELYRDEEGKVTKTEDTELKLPEKAPIKR